MNNFTAYESILMARAGGKVERAHTVPHIGSYSVAAHSWGVAMLMLQLWPDDFPRLAKYCIAHDVPEAWTGDVPASTKRYSPELKQGMQRMESVLLGMLSLPDDADLDADDRAKLKACDQLELYLWCIEQQRLGNQYAQEIREELSSFWAEVPLPYPASGIYAAIRNPNISNEARYAGVMKELLRDVK